jgi:hypothetical protein
VDLSSFSYHLSVSSLIKYYSSESPTKLITDLFSEIEQIDFLIKKAKQSRYTPWWRLGERRYSSNSFLTSALDGVSG